MATLTSDQQQRIDTLVDHISTFPLPDAIQVLGRLTIPTHTTEAEKNQHRQLISSAYLFKRIQSYIVWLRYIEDYRRKIGMETFSHVDILDNYSTQTPDKIVTALVMSEHLAGLQEVSFHLWAVCVAQIETLLPMASKHFGYKVPSADLALLHSYVPLRDFYEHLESRLPGKPKASEQVTEEMVGDHLHITIGLDTDKQGRVLLNGQAMDVSGDGLAQIQKILDRTYEGMNVGILDRLRAHLVAHPTEIPAPEDIVTRSPIMIRSTGG